MVLILYINSISIVCKEHGGILWAGEFYKGALIMLHNVFMTTYPLVFEESVER